MEDFEFISPTKIYFGKQKYLRIAEILKVYNKNNILIVIGQHHLKSSGLLDQILNLLNKSNISYLILDNIRPNPIKKDVIKGLDLIKNKNIDLILAIGGGSVIDTAKSISVNYYYDKDVFDFNLKKAIPTKSLPIGVILTIPASGSELSNSCVIQDDELKIKKGFNSDLVRPLFVIEDPTLTLSLPKYQTMCGIVDILMHTFERFLSKSSDEMLADYLAIGLLKNVIDNSLKLLKNPNDYDARANIMLASSFSHNNLTNLGKNHNMPVHYLEHILSGIYPSVAHGAGLAVIFLQFLKEFFEQDYKKLAILNKYLFNTFIENERECGKLFIENLQNYFKILGMPLSFADLGITNCDINELAKQFVKNGTREIDHNGKMLNEEISKNIFIRCLGGKNQ